MSDLDDPRSYAVDSANMFGHIERLGSELQAAWGETAGMNSPAGPFKDIVIAAMGGSAAAADYFAALAYGHSPMPVRVIRGYELPEFVDSGSLVIALSYSGGTEEVLACYTQARSRGAASLAISHGGALQEMAASDGAPFHRVSYESPPRAALSHLLAPLLRVGQRLGLLGLCDEDIAVAANGHAQLVSNHIGRAVPAAGNAAKQLAGLLPEANPLVVIAAEHLAPAGLRTKNQLAENAKVLATFEEGPEVTHNIIEALDPRGALHPVAVAFASPALAPSNRRRVELVAGRFEEAGGAMAGLQMRGTSRLADMLEASAWGDHLSCYLAVLRETDPTPTPGLVRMREGMGGPAVGD